MQAAFENFIRGKKLFQPQNRILLAVSGGVDSVVMAHLFYQSDFNFAIAHCNFNLRGEESDQDARFVESLAQSYEVPFFVQRFDTLTIAQSLGLSTQMAARKLRYDWFQELLTLQHFDYLATAHHQNDDFETVLLNLTRGTGIAGLHGIPLQQGKIIRPLLFLSRQAIEDYAQVQQISWREDASNQENSYIRNLVRHEVIPILKKINPNLEKTWQQSAEKIQAVERLFKIQVEELGKEIIKEQADSTWIYFKKLQEIPEPSLQLFSLLEKYGFSYPQCKSMIDSLKNISGSMFESPEYQIVKDREAFILSPKIIKDLPSYTLEEYQEVLEGFDFNLRIRIIEDVETYRISRDAQVACLDFALLQFPLQIRPWQLGDWFYPLGMKHRKKLSDFFIDAKISRMAKQKAYVLCSGNEIAWLMAYRIDDRFKIKNSTKKILEIRKYTKPAP